MQYVGLETARRLAAETKAPCAAMSQFCSDAAIGRCVSATLTARVFNFYRSHSQSVTLRLHSRTRNSDMTKEQHGLGTRCRPRDLKSADR